mmetsp:Transcript_20405/g.62864  ORF Transcript_20405/g.62864 Transcript_20405/m.62864 type:complete len:144 (-) Transcript_20405:264-695(-)
MTGSRERAPLELRAYGDGGDPRRSSVGLHLVLELKTCKNTSRQNRLDRLANKISTIHSNIFLASLRILLSSLDSSPVPSSTIPCCKSLAETRPSPPSTPSRGRHQHRTWRWRGSQSKCAPPHLPSVLPVEAMAFPHLRYLRTA